jgi:hypothetical protein
MPIRHARRFVLLTVLLLGGCAGHQVAQCKGPFMALNASPASVTPAVQPIVGVAR